MFEVPLELLPEVDARGRPSSPPETEVLVVVPADAQLPMCDFIAIRSELALARVDRDEEGRHDEVSCDKSGEAH